MARNQDNSSVDDGSRRPSVKATENFNGNGGELRSSVSPSEPLKSASRMATRISDVLFRTREDSFSSIASFASNADAVDAGLLFLNGVEKFVVILGPSGSGKTHLMNVMSAHFRQRGLPVEGVRSAAEYFRQPHNSDADCPLLLDDCHEIWASPKQKMALRLQLERRVRAGRPTVLSFTQDSPSRLLAALLPQRREWRITQISSPSAEERLKLVQKMAKNEGIHLCPRLGRIMASEIPGSASALSGALKTLKLVDHEWKDARAVLRSLSLMDPHFGGNSAWDLRHRLLKLAKDPQHVSEGVQPLDLALYTLVHVVGMPESHIEAGTNLKCTEIYRRASTFRRLVEDHAEIAAIADRFVEAAAVAIGG